MSAALNNDFFGSGKISRILLKIAPPVMLAQLIQALYNVVDSFFVGRFSDDALTAVSVVYPIQIVITAFSVGTGVGLNTYMAREYALGKPKRANEAAGAGTVLAILSWAVFAVLSAVVMRPYVMTSASEPEAIKDAVTYGRIVCIGSLGTFLESTWSKVHQSRGNMQLPMIAQIAGALTNVIFDPLLIFGMGPIKAMGVAGAAYATVLGQFVSALIVGVSGYCRPPKAFKMPYYFKYIYKYGYSSIAMQLLYTVYIIGLNIILAGFSDSAVTVLALYYKSQNFFFIPLIGLQTCIVPLISYNYTRREYNRCRTAMLDCLIITLSFMIVGFICFVFFPDVLLKVFSKSDEVLKIGHNAFPIIGCSFFGAAFSLFMPTFFQAIGAGFRSLLLSLTRQIFVLLPVFWAFSKVGLDYTWFAFPVAEYTAGTLGVILYFLELKKWKNKTYINPALLSRI